MAPFSFSLLSALFSGLALAELRCRPNGPIVPRPTNLASSETINSALEELGSTLQKAIDGEIKAGWDTQNGSFSIAVVSLDQPDPAVPVWEFHHLSAANEKGTKEIDRDSQYLIGSISKAISDLILLKSGVDPDTPVRKYLPALDGGPINWGDITLRDLGNHQAGIPPNYGFSEYYYLKDVLELLGFPRLEDSDYPKCGVIALNGGCDAEATQEGLVDSYPVAKVSTTPVYSNMAFTLIALALKEATGNNYTQLLDELISQPLGLKSTRESPGDDDKAVIPPGESTWGSDYGINAPGGGLVSTLSDLSVFAHGILSRSSKILPSEAAINAWLKPNSATGSLNSLVGLPWEIFRTANLTPKHPHVIDIYAKGGGAYNYRSQLSLIDEYGVGIIILTAGASGALTPIYDAVLTTIVPAIDEVARQQAQQYAGEFGAISNGVVVNATLELDDDSIIIQSLNRDGHDILEGFQVIFSQAFGSILGLGVAGPRLFPTGVKTPGEVKLCNGTRAVVREDWRLNWSEFVNFEESELPGVGVTAQDCLSWTLADWMHYGKEPLDRYIFVTDAESGEVLGFEVPFLRSGLLQKAG
ncbi:Uncharacterized protein SAPIO_CDS0356 [Scedosporium apiospermum]|uniref:Uncharacterized protein n=1 Tax=Pseudallescheria apiosperma TaxID=563466 RepID=A0A084GGU8_PSEDA|nr:Uncharacterized protein SAPIO_CDS0356 [Scedosporium apiospermum]KEZ46560.1 Uncharacterized protein SAPIO_CDS0356 [Scedosporium apiospermum]